jgi:hypothetical protein
MISPLWKISVPEGLTKIRTVANINNWAEIRAFSLLSAAFFSALPASVQTAPAIWVWFWVCSGSPEVLPVLYRGL